jgi:hypothetical protein
VVGDVILVVILLAIPVGFFFTRRARGAGALPGMEARDGLVDSQLQRVEHAEAFEDERPEGQ